MSKKGIDVSYAQGKIDWEKVKKSGVEFAMIRACYGWDNDEQIDRYFRSNVAGCEAEGLPYGLYHYSYAKTPEEAKKEARFFLRVIKGMKPEYPVMFDLEDASQQRLGKETLTAIAKAFLSEVESAGYYAMLYANKYWLTGLLDMSQLEKYDVWLAQWSGQASYTGGYGMWQYSPSGSVPGIEGPVDLDLAYRDYPAIIKGAGKNGWADDSTPAPDYRGLYQAEAQKVQSLKDGIGGVIQKMQKMLR